MAEPWNAFAEREPYFAVLTDPRYLRANLDAAAEAELFASGAALVTEIVHVIHEHVVPRFTPLTVLEYGCGVGRLLIPFARRAESATGVDIAPAMLHVAREQARKAGVANIDLSTPNEFERDERQFDLVNCYLLLQRLRRSEGMALLRELARRVRPGGVGVFQFPYRSNAGALLSLTRKTRARVPGVNALLNAVRRKSLPFIPSNTYDVNEVFALLQEAKFDSPHVEFAKHGELDTAVIYAQRRPELTAAPVRRETEIDVKQLIEHASIEELNRKAEEYFASLKNREAHLAKPFTRADEAPPILINLAVLLQGLALTPGMTVLEFGAGTGWLSRYLTQLGCRTILLDVSPTALEIARELFARQPVIGERPEPRFLVFDGRHIDLPDASVDRVVCFDAFHHAVNPGEMLREFARVLRPAGIAGFAEPGPEHSTTAHSQYEMRTYGVVENDIDIHAIWETARAAGFAELKLAAFNVTPFQVSLREYDDLLAGGPTYGKWAEHTRAFMKNVRDFFLIKSGTIELDSRHTTGLHATIEATLLSPRTLSVTVRNTGRARWLSSSEIDGGVSLGTHLYDSGGHLIALEFTRHPLPRALDAAEHVTFEIELPALEPGRYILELDCVANNVAWFAQAGSTPARITLECGGLPPL